MAKSKVKRYFEPWTTSKSQDHGKMPFSDGVTDGLPPEAVVTLQEAWGRIDDNASWIIWGSGMSEPVICRDLLTGQGVFMDDKRIIAIRSQKGLPDGSPTHEQIAKRIAACVNSCAGIADPEKFVTDVRGLLLDLTKGEYDPSNDHRAVSLLSRCIPLKDEEITHEKDE